MGTYVIGDIHGCFEELQQLLETIGYDARRDRLRLVGDLVNRGPDSAAVVRWARSQGDSVVAVLGNHDLRLIALACRACQPRPTDDFGSLLEPGEGTELVEWLAARPLLHVGEEGRVLVHAGLLPHWSLEEAAGIAGAAAALIRGPRRREFLSRVFSIPLESSAPRNPFDRTAWTAQVLTRLRVCTESGRPCGDFTGRPSEAPDGCRPWFEWPSARPPSTRVFAGHWAMLGLHVESAIVALDTGCVYGGQLTAFRTDDGAIFQVPARR